MTSLTVGMATYEDYDGVYFSVQALRLYHPEVMDQVEILVIDNCPDGKHGKEVKKFMEDNVPNGRYIPFTEYESCFVKGQVFEQARSDYVLCIDCHVMLAPGSLKQLISYYTAFPNTKDLIQGPLIHEDLIGYSTHLNMEWQNQAYGHWATDENLLKSGEAFEIPAMGCGIFSCKKEHWPGFHPLLRGFGGEEFYLHEKFRQRGGRALCLPFLKWLHRFGRPEGVKYLIDMHCKARNFMIGWMELYKDKNHPMIRSIIDHFTEWNYTREELERLLDNVIEEMDSNVLHVTSLEEKFTDIYKSKKWGNKDTLSGSGSRLDQTKKCIVELPKLLKDYKIKSLLDAPCGDFFWMEKVKLGNTKYIGADIVPDIITNNKQYETKNKSFRQLDITKDDLPKVDLILVRDCLVHLTHEDIMNFIDNLSRSDIKYLLTTTFPDRDHNPKISTGNWRPLNLQIPPFSLPEPIKIINEGCTESGGIYKDKSLGLWRIEDLIKEKEYEIPGTQGPIQSRSSDS